MNSQGLYADGEQREIIAAAAAMRAALMVISKDKIFDPGYSTPLDVVKANSKLAKSALASDAGKSLLDEMERLRKRLEAAEALAEMAEIWRGMLPEKEIKPLLEEWRKLTQEAT